MTTFPPNVVELGDDTLRSCSHAALRLSRHGFVIRTSGLLGLAVSDLYEVAVLANLTLDPPSAPLPPDRRRHRHSTDDYVYARPLAPSWLGICAWLRCAVVYGAPERSVAGAGTPPST